MFRLLLWSHTVFIIVATHLVIYCSYYIRRSATGSKRWIVFLDGKYQTTLHEQTKTTV